MGKMVLFCLKMACFFIKIPVSSKNELSGFKSPVSERPVPTKDGQFDF